MKQVLKISETIYHINPFGEKIDGAHPRLYGDYSNLLYGDCTHLRGIVSRNLIGNLTGLNGDCTGVSGNLDECEITDDDRKNMVNIRDLITDVSWKIFLAKH